MSSKESNNEREIKKDNGEEEEEEKGRKKKEKKWSENKKYKYPMMGLQATRVIIASTTGFDLPIDAVMQPVVKAIAKGKTSPNVGSKEVQNDRKWIKLRNRFSKESIKDVKLDATKNMLNDLGNTNQEIDLNKYDLQEDEKIRIIKTIEEDKKPVSQNEINLDNNIEVLTNIWIPLKYEHWFDVPKEVKTQTLHRLLQHFNLEYDQKVVVDYLEWKMSISHKEFQSTLWKYYKSFKSPEEARAHRYPQVEDETDWALLCEKWEARRWKHISSINSSRQNHPFNHRTSSRSSHKVMEEK